LIAWVRSHLTISRFDQSPAWTNLLRWSGLKVNATLIAA